MSIACGQDGEAPLEEAGRAERPPEQRSVAPQTGVVGGNEDGARRGSEDGDVDRLEALGWEVVVNEVVDGDTIEAGVPLGGFGELRLIGVDAPEGKGSGAEPYGETAYLFSEIALQENEVALEFDRQRTNSRGGLLAYVYLPDGTMLNEVLLREGYAQVAPSPPNVRYAGRLRAAQEEARRADRGLWSLSGDELCRLKNHGNGIGKGSVGCSEHPAERASLPQ